MNESFDLVVHGPGFDAQSGNDIALLCGNSQVTVRREDGHARLPLQTAPSSQLRDALAAYCTGHALDFAFVPTGKKLADFGLVAMDMDSTLITIECIDEIADMQGIKPQVAAITASAMRGEIAFPESLRRRVLLLAGLPEAALQRVYDERLRLSPGAEAMLARLKALGIKTLLVSGGFTFFTEKLKQRLGLDHTLSNTLEIADGKLTGRVLGNIVDAAAKAARLVELRDSLGLRKDQVIALGDGANDLLMLAEAGVSIAYHAKPVVREKATYSFNHAGLDGVLALYPVSKESIISVKGLSKTYGHTFQALKNINLDIREGEIFALLGPNGAGKTTLIGAICGIVRITEGSVSVNGHDVVRDYRAARELIGLVPQELTTDAFESVWATVSFSRGLFGKPANPAHIEKVLKELSLWDKKDNKILTLSGGMKRRVLIAKALAHEPRILFLDEPTAGVDVTLRQDMWKLVRQLRETGVTIILTTHYIEEAEEMADRVGVINKGEIILVENKAELMRKLGSKQLTLQLSQPLTAIPPSLSSYGPQLVAKGSELTYTYDERGVHDDKIGIPALLRDLEAAGIHFKDLHTTQSSLEDIFVTLLNGKPT